MEWTQGSKAKFDQFANWNPQLYLTNPENFDGVQLQKPVREADINILLDDYSGQPVIYKECIAAAIKEFLPDLPSPSNCEEAYNLFIHVTTAIAKESGELNFRWDLILLYIFTAAVLFFASNKQWYLNIFRSRTVVHTILSRYVGPVL